MVQMYWGSTKAADHLALLNIIPPKELDSPRRSVVPLADFWRTPGERLHELGELIGVQLEAPAELIFEYAVPVQNGKGKASFTDLMILTHNTAVAVEAKYTEPEYESVRSWLGDQTEGNRVDVLNGWLDLINQKTGSTLRSEHVAELPYQLIHRTASACYPKVAKAALVYLVFHEAAPEHYAAHLSALSALLPDRSALSLHLISCAAKGREAHAAQVSKWDAGERTLNEGVRVALCAGPLFEFGSASVTTF